MIASSREHHAPSGQVGLLQPERLRALHEQVRLDEAVGGGLIKAAWAGMGCRRLPRNQVLQSRR